LKDIIENYKNFDKKAKENNKKLKEEDQIEIIIIIIIEITKIINLILRI
jgi:hypothetical protein